MMQHDRIWVDEKGHVLPLTSCSNEQLIARFRKVVDDHIDERVKNSAVIDALTKRLKDHRKAKSLANKRADIAVKAMKDMLETFGSKE